MVSRTSDSSDESRRLYKRHAQATPASQVFSAIGSKPIVVSPRLKATADLRQMARPVVGLDPVTKNWAEKFVAANFGIEAVNHTTDHALVNHVW
ncbi:MAG: hypothetical protein E5V34_09580 [Mesorhizobium sp.]|nr:MAG: hypothetical protein E5V34_09580 [Mesorhizobium sp.]